MQKTAAEKLTTDIAKAMENYFKDLTETNDQ